MSYLCREHAAKEKLEIVSGATLPPFRIFAGGLPRRRRRRNAFGLIQEYCMGDGGRGRRVNLKPPSSDEGGFMMSFADFKDLGLFQVPPGLTAPRYCLPRL